MNISGAPWRPRDSSSASTQKSVSIVTDTRQASTLRLCQSITAARYTNPLAIGMYVISIAHTWLGLLTSTGFATSTYARWFDHKWGKERTRQTWVKTHLMVGVQTHIVTAVEATATESSDNTQFPSLVAQTARQFSVNEISADKAYSSRQSLHAVQEVGGTPYIPFKQGSTGTPRKQAFDGLWARAWHLYNFNRDDFNAHYHKRSNAETAMAMIKSKFGASVKSKSPVAQVNEVLCKVLAHNICVLIVVVLRLCQ